MIQTMMTPARILMVASSGQRDLASVSGLTAMGCAVDWATSEAEALGRTVAWAPDLVVIADSPSQEGCVELALRLRSIAGQAAAPVVLFPAECDLSGAGGCKSPVDAFLTQIAQILQKKAALSSFASECVQQKGLRLDRDRHRAWLNNEPIHLTPTEFNLLWELASRPGFVLSRRDLARVCKGDGDGIQNRTIDAHVKSIRRKLVNHSEWIETVHGLGYRFQDGNR